MIGAEDDGGAPTPRETGAHDRAALNAALARQLACRLVAAADEERSFGKGLALRAVARRCRAAADFFDCWTRGESTLEQRVEDLARWADAKAQAAELGVR